MKKILVFVLLAGAVFVTLTGCLSEYNDGSPYPKGGRDTVAEFGIRRFVVLRGINTGTKKAEWCLYDREIDGYIDPDIDNFEEIEPFVYAIGSKGYTKVNYETGEKHQSEDISEFSEDDQAVFIFLELTEYKVIKK